MLARRAGNVPVGMQQNSPGDFQLAFGRDWPGQQVFPGPQTQAVAHQVIGNVFRQAQTNRSVAANDGERATADKGIGLVLALWRLYIERDATDARYAAPTEPDTVERTRPLKQHETPKAQASGFFIGVQVGITESCIDVTNPGGGQF